MGNTWASGESWGGEVQSSICVGRMIFNDPLRVTRGCPRDLRKLELSGGYGFCAWGGFGRIQCWKVVARYWCFTTSLRDLKF